MSSAHKVSTEVMTAHLDGEAVLLHLGTKAYFKLNDTGAAIWKGLEAGETDDELVERLTTTFEVDAETARTEVRRVIEELMGKELLVG